jgi:phospholipase/lecithinase/hemolysin
MIIKIKLFTLLLGSISVLLVGCGGGSSNSSNTVSPPKFSQLVVFGDSLSDSGAYKVGTVDAVGGGKFTVNSPSAKVWVENVAQSLGFANACTAQTGLPSILPFAASQGFFGASIVENNSCTNYAQGAARVTNPISFDSFGMQQALLSMGLTTEAIGLAPLGKMATPVEVQMTKHLARNPSGYTGKELVIVSIGANDLLMNLTAIGLVAEEKWDSAALFAAFSGWSETIRAQLADPGLSTQQKLGISVSAASDNMSRLATTLSDNIQSQIINKGAKNIAVLNLPDVGKTPLMLSGGPAISMIATNLTQVFNLKLASDINKLPILLVDAFAQSDLQLSNPSAYGITNTTSMACAEGVPPNNQFLNKSSLGCSSATVIKNVDTSRYLYADSVHPTPFGHQLLSNYFLTTLTVSNLGN